MARLFISKQRLDDWTQRGFVQVEGSRMTLTDGKSFNLVDGVYFEEVVGGDPDPNDLVGKVKTVQQLVELGAEHYKDTALLGNTGYNVHEGFIGEP